MTLTRVGARIWELKKAAPHSYSHEARHSASLEHTMLVSSLLIHTWSMAMLEDRVADARRNAAPALKALAKKAKLPHPIPRIYLRAHKLERELEVWGAEPGIGNSFVLVKTYPIAAMSGTLGPKRKEGDKQAPEGLYFVDRFNPQSSFHLSLGINYPNASDKILSDPKKPGGDIFIHGRQVSIGCLAMTDPAIEEIYLMALDAIKAGQRRVRVEIFPFQMTSQKLREEEKKRPELAVFWRNLARFWQAFEANGFPARYSVDEAGRYEMAAGYFGRSR